MKRAELEIAKYNHSSLEVLSPNRNSQCRTKKTKYMFQLKMILTKQNTLMSILVIMNLYSDSPHMILQKSKNTLQI